jgi:hypothetical protein
MGINKVSDADGLVSCVSGVSEKKQKHRMVSCYQVQARFAFCRHKSVLVSAEIKKQKAMAFLVLSGVPFGRPLNQSRFFKTEKEALGFAAYLNALYKGRFCPNPRALRKGQLELFQEVSK